MSFENSPTPCSVLEIPIDDNRCGDSPFSDLSRQLIVPEFGATKPQITLNSVVLPAPLGPITPTTSPPAASTETSSRALIPPKETVTSRTARPAAAGTSLESTPGKLHQRRRKWQIETRGATSS